MNAPPTLESVAAKLASDEPSLFAADEVRVLVAELAITWHALGVAHDALLETVPYMNNVASDPANAPWRRETATDILRRVRVAVAEARYTYPGALARLPNPGALVQDRTTE